MSATINDIAARCGVPAMTVRRILASRAADISEETRAAVLAAAGDGQCDRRPYNLALLFQDENTLGLTHPFFGAVLNAFKREAEIQGCDVTFINQSEGGREFSSLDRCRLRNVDGVCMVCLDFRAASTVQVARSGIPCVTIDHIFEGIPAVLSDNESGVRMLVDHAFSMGHNRIAFIHGHNNSLVTRTRIDQFSRAIAAHGIHPRQEYLCSGMYGDVALTHDLVTELLNLPEPPTCILLPDDTAYFGALEAAMNLELRIPSDISFAGYDGTALTQALRPRLTTIRQKSDELGQTAARRLLELIEHPETVSPAPVWIPVELLPGGTVGWCEQY